MAAHDDPGNVGNDAPTNRSADQATLLRELIEALTALGNYLAAAHREFEKQPCERQEALSGALRKSVSQYDRAAECLRRLRQLLLRDRRSNADQQGID